MVRRAGREPLHIVLSCARSQETLRSTQHQARRYGFRSNDETGFHLGQGVRRTISLCALQTPYSSLNVKAVSFRRFMPPHEGKSSSDVDMTEIE